MDFVGGGGGVTNGGLGSENGPILYSEPNRTSAIDDIRSVVIYIFIITIFLSFFLILPGIRNEKFPTFLCITTSLIVTSIILVALFGTTWHVGIAPISAPYKAFSRDRIQGVLSVNIGLQSVNITLSAHKFYSLHATHGPIMMDNSPTKGAKLSFTTSNSQQSNGVSSFIDQEHQLNSQSESNLAEELLRGRTSDGATVDTELEVDEVFAESSSSKSKESTLRKTRSSANTTTTMTTTKLNTLTAQGIGQIQKRSTGVSEAVPKSYIKQSNTTLAGGQKYTIKRVNVDINYNERFYWIEPNQMRQEHHNALERGLPYPILTVVEYLSQDEAGFSWSRQYRLAGYYSYIILWLSLCVCVLMFFLHCAAPKYGIYTMQILGCLLLFTNFTYAILVPRGEQKLVIPFEGQSLSFKFGWNFWLVLIGGCLSLIVGTLIVIIDTLFPNFIFTTILDVDFDSHNKYYKHRRIQNNKIINDRNAFDGRNPHERPVKPPFFDDSTKTGSTSKASASSSQPSRSTTENQSANMLDHDIVDKSRANQQTFSKNHLVKVTTGNAGSASIEVNEKKSSQLDQLFVGSLIKRSTGISLTNDSEIKRVQKKRDSSVVEMHGEDSSSDTYLHKRHRQAEAKSRQHHHYAKNSQTSKNINPKSTDHRPRRLTSNDETGNVNSQVRL